MTQTNLWKFADDNNVSGYTLIIPCVAVGNVGQLACDLLISSLKMKKFASAYSTALIPILGYDPYNLASNNLSSSCEVYKSDTRKLVVMQLRAPLVYKYARNFLEDFIYKFMEKDIKDIVILTSSFAHEKKHILTSSFRYVMNESCSYKNHIKKLNCLKYESEDGSLKIYGGGFVSLLYDICKDKLPCLILYKYCSEGDNIPDAYDMVCCLSNILPIFNQKMDLMSQLVQPASWKLLFGRPPPKDIY